MGDPARRGRQRGAGGGGSPRTIVMLPQALEDLEFWVSSDRKVVLRVLRLIEDARRHPFEGIGKPEPLKHIGVDIWSRRITKRDRLVYRVTDETVGLLQARYHY